MLSQLLPILSLMGLSSGLPSILVGPRQSSLSTTITIDLTKTYNLISGFGTSEAFQRE